MADVRKTYDTFCPRAVPAPVSDFTVRVKVVYTQPHKPRSLPTPLQCLFVKQKLGISHTTKIINIGQTALFNKISGMVHLVACLLLAASYFLANCHRISFKSNPNKRMLIRWSSFYHFYLLAILVCSGLGIWLVKAAL